MSVLQSTFSFAEDPVIIRVDGSSVTLEGAVETANSKDSAIIQIVNDITVISNIIITSDIAIVGAEGTHTVTMSSAIQVKDGGSFTLGDGTSTNILTILGAVSVVNGSVNIKDGVVLKSGRYALSLSSLNATGVISGGHIEGALRALSLEGGAKISEISGGIFYGTQETVYLFGNHTRIEKISGGSFYQTDTTVTIHGQTIFVDSNATIGTISGGYFEAVRNSAMLIIRGAWVEKISGGDFVATRIGTDFAADAPNPRNAVMRRF